jgi:membrane protein implicated in regulation of membrane protease activity
MIESPEVAWATIGLMLAIFELFVPGTYLIWFGFAAFVVSAYTWFTGVGITDQLIVFAIFSAIFAFLGLYAYKAVFQKVKSDDKYKDLNDPAKQYIGRVVTLVQNVDDNNTKVKIGDTVWLAYTEQNLKKGDKAKVTGVKDGVVLIVKKEK